MKTVLVTGGSGGIGAATCRLAALSGWSVWVGYREGRDRALAVVESVEQAGGRARPLRLPLEDPQAVAAALEDLAKTGERLDAVALCASPAPQPVSFLKTGRDSLLEHFAVNAAANQQLLASVWKLFFAKNPGGHAVAVLSDAAGPSPKPHMTSYVVGKRALQAVLECALLELGAAGLRASAVCPGYTETPMLKAFHPHVLEAARAGQAGGTFLTPERVAQEIVACLERVPPSVELALRSVTNAQTGGR